MYKDLTEEDKKQLGEAYGNGFKLDKIKAHFSVNEADIYMVLRELRIKPDRNSGAAVTRKRRKASRKYYEKSKEARNFNVSVGGVTFTLELGEGVIVRGLNATAKGSIIRVEAV